MNFSVNQVRHLYVAKALKEEDAPLAVAGDIAVKTDVDGKLYFQYYGSDGLMRSDIIENISYAKATDASKMATPLKNVTVTVTNLPTPGEDVVMRIDVRLFAGMSDEETYSISASARVKSGSNANSIAAELKDNLEKNLKKMYGKLFTVSVSNASITIQEVPQEWTLGIKEQVPVYFEVTLVPALIAGIEDVWGTAVKGSTGSINNGHKIADLEYFCMGERGDQYRNIGWPNVIKTDYLVDPSKPYHVLDIHYAYQGTCEDIQKSEKDITIVAEDKSVLNGIITAVNAAIGTEITAL